MKLIIALVLNLIVSMLLALMVSVAFAFFAVVFMLAILTLAAVGYPEDEFWA